MPDIDPAALSRQDSISQPLTSLVINKTNGASAAPAQKTPKAPNTVQRIDLEPLYTSLKAAIGDQWGKYKEATSLFVLGMYCIYCFTARETIRKVLIKLRYWPRRSAQPKRAIPSNRPFLQRGPFN